MGLEDTIQHIDIKYVTRLYGHTWDMWETYGRKSRGHTHTSDWHDGHKHMDINRWQRRCAHNTKWVGGGERAINGIGSERREVQLPGRLSCAMTPSPL